MPSRRHSRLRSRRAADASLRQVIGLALDVEQPLTDVAHLLRALRLIGYGIGLDDENGAAISEVARHAAERTAVARSKWDRLIEKARKNLACR